MHTSHRCTYRNSSELEGVGGFGRESGAVRAAGERTWSRAGGQGADEWGFVIRHECILFIFFKTLPTRRGTDTEEETQRKRQVGDYRRKVMQSGLSSMSTPSAGQCVPQSWPPGVRCLSLTPIHPPSVP